MTRFNWMRKAALCFTLFAVRAWAGDGFPALKVLPWNGHHAATSLTFDDGDPSQLDVAVPELDRRHLHATFFLIANRITRKDDWRKILPMGNEIGNHTLDHLHADSLTPAQEEAQVLGARNVLQKEFGINLYTFAYPYDEVTPSLEAMVAQDHLLARGGYGKSFVLTPAMDPDWMDLPSRAMEPQIPFGTYKKWIGECFHKGGWLVWRAHGLEGAPPERKPITKEMFGRILDDLQSKDVWIGTFLEVGSYFRAEKIFENTVVKRGASQEEWTWALPEHFPQGVTLKIRLTFSNSLDSDKAELRQDGHALLPDSRGIYTIDFDHKELTLILSPKS